MSPITLSVSEDVSIHVKYKYFLILNLSFIDFIMMFSFFVLSFYVCYPKEILKIQIPT